MPESLSGQDRQRRLACLFLSLICFASGIAADNARDSTATLDPVMVYGRSVDLLGEASAASDGEVGATDLASRPFLRRGELLEVVPGLVVTQPSGSGKANQYFLRGFNLDHGTDFAVSGDGMPVNMRTARVTRISTSSFLNWFPASPTRRANTPPPTVISPPPAPRNSISWIRSPKTWFA